MTDTLHIISHTHWDREWYLTFQQFRLKLVHLVDCLLQILENDPEFKHFMLDGQTIILDDYLQMRPEKEAILRQHVQNGRIQIGPWHILPDMFLVGPEAHIRNLLQGRRTVARFGSAMQVGYIPDPFGHPGQVPQILCGFGIDSAAVWRGVGDQPCEFWWQAPDGSRVMMAYLRDSYSNGASLTAGDPAQFTAQLENIKESLAQHSASRDLLVMFGSDHVEPAPGTSAAIAYANVHLADTQVLQSTLPDNIKLLSDQLIGMDLPVVVGELRDCSRAPLLPGVLSTRMWIKQRNAACETLLEKWAEPFGTFAALYAPSQVEVKDVDGSKDFDQREENDGLADTAPLIRQAWRLLMENHPHDSICGCSIDQVAVEMGTRFDQVEQIGEELTRQSLRALAMQVNTLSTGALAAVVVYNPSSTARRDLVQVHMTVAEDIPGFKLIDRDGSEVQYELRGNTSGEFANMVVDKKGLHEMFANIHDGRAAGVAIVDIKLGEPGPTVSIDAIVSEFDQPNMAAWKQAMQDLLRIEDNPRVTHFHIRARMQRSSQLRFVSPEIPAHGWCVLWAKPIEDVPITAPATLSPIIKSLLPLALRAANIPPVAKLLRRLIPRDETKPPFVIENQHLRVEASTQDGTLSILDKATGKVFRGLNRFVDGGEAGDEYNYSPPVSDRMVTAQLSSLKVFRSELVPTLEITYRMRVPSHLEADRSSRAAEMVDIPILSRVTLARGVKRLDIHTEIDNRACDHRLRVHFPSSIQADEADHDGHFEVVRRKIDIPEKGSDWVEDPRPETHQRAFTDVSNGEVGLMIANRGLPEVEVLRTQSGTEIALTLMRCVGWLSRDDLPVRRGHAGPGTETPGAQLLGSWSFDYSVIPHLGSWESAYQQAYAFIAPLRAISTTLHPGELPSMGSFIDHSPAEFVISAVKESEEGQGWLVRGYNISSKALEVTLRPCHPPDGMGSQPAHTAALVNLAEQVITPLAMDENGTVHFPVGGHAIVTVRFQAGRK